MSTWHWARPSVLAAALMACLTPGLAQTTSPIRHGFDAAWARQPEQHAAPLRREAAAAHLDAARRWTPEPPAIELAARTDQLNRNAGRREYDATIAVPLWLPGERARTEAVATAESAALGARLAAAQWRLAGEVREAHWAHRRARVANELTGQRLASAQQIAADVARRVKAGDLARADGHQAEAATAAAQAALADTATALAQAARHWTLLTGQPPADVPQAPGGDAEPRSAGEPAGQHPALHELAARADVARRQKDLAAVQTRTSPELTLGAGRERDGFGERYGQTVTLGIRLPLGRSSASPARQALAAAELLEAERQLALEAEKTRSMAELAQARLQGLESALAAAELRAQLARETQGFFDKAFRAGESDLPTRLRTELDAFEATRQAVLARIEVDAAVSQLRQALGLLPE